MSHQCPNSKKALSAVSFLFFYFTATGSDWVKLEALTAEVLFDVFDRSRFCVFSLYNSINFFYF